MTNAQFVFCSTALHGFTQHVDLHRLLALQLRRCLNASVKSDAPPGGPCRELLPCRNFFNEQAFRIAGVLASTETILSAATLFLDQRSLFFGRPPTPHLTETSMRSPMAYHERPERRQLLES
ncbi:hypothetical protein ACH79_38865 [Bradyrhizobium sp. CCBAU 051011]|nr:hypothetical protein ACH79_38865 [Bradyrhizobium sp. CCBAU 051011]